MKILSNKNFLKIYEEINKLDNVENMIVISIDLDDSKKFFNGRISDESKKIIQEQLSIQFPNFYVTSFGNDTFSIMNFNENYNLIEIGQRKEKLHTLLSETFNKEITFCWGIVSYPQTIKNSRELLAISFETLYQAKSKGKDSVHIYEESSMKLKSIYFRRGQLIQLQNVSKQMNRAESEILREALDDYLNKNLYHS